MMSLLLDEVALAAARLAEAGVESPRTDAELIAASVHRVRRGELHTVPDSAFDARFWSDVARRAAPSRRLFAEWRRGLVSPQATATARPTVITPTTSRI